jgi:hypothetical protein
MDKVQKNLNKIAYESNDIILEIEQIENILEIFRYIDDEAMIKIKVVKTTSENIEYRLKKINKLLEKIDELTFLC